MAVTISLLSLPVSAQVSTAPALPLVVLDTTYVAPSGRTLAVAAGGDFQAALDAAQPGDVIELQAGATFTGNFTLPYKTGTGWIYIQPSALASLPPAGSRVSAADAALMPKLVSPNTSAALRAATGAHHYRVVGVEITATLVDTSATHYGLVTLDSGSDFVLDRVYVHGTPTGNYKRGVQLNSARTAVIDSYLSEFHATGQDAQAIAGWNGPGPFKIVNNHLEGSGENLMFGGADPTVADLVPSDIEIRRNHFVKPLSWRVGDPSYAGIHWSVKNLLELKNARRVLIDGNLFENNWQDAQGGTAILFTVRNQGGTAPWSTVEDVTFTNNIVRHTGSAIGMHGWDDLQPSQQTRRILIGNNLFDDVSSARWGGAGRLFEAFKGIVDLVIDHNTGFMDRAVMYADGGTHTGFVYTNNLTPTGAYGFTGTGTRQGTDTLDTYFPGAVFLRNVLAGGNPSYYPPDNFFPATLDAVDFVDLAGGDYRLAATSPYKSAGTDGKDIGADIDAIEAALAGVLSAPPAADTTPPTVAVTSPANGASVAGTVTVAASATDDMGVAGVQFKLDGSSFGSEIASPPYAVAWDTLTAANGTHTLSAVARDAAGNTATSASVGVTVLNGDLTPPAVSITAPAAGTTVTGTVTVSASATDAVGVAGVQFRVDGTALGPELAAAPYTTSWNTSGGADGIRTLTAVARDAAGNAATSTGIAVTVANAGTTGSDVTPPGISAVAATSITAGGATITWTTGEASDTQVEYGPTTAYGGLAPLNTTLVTMHAQTLGGLGAGALYHYRVRSRDTAGNLAVSGDFTFTTLAVPVVTDPANATTPGAVRTASTIHSIGIEWDVAGDPNHNAMASVQYRVQSASTWKSALSLVRVDYNGSNILAGSILFLAPKTAYEVKLDLYDPDGGADSRVVTVTTRPVPELPTGGRTLHVVPGSGGGDGSEANPFKGIPAAQAAAGPGDIVLVHAGDYGGRIAFDKPGSAGSYLVWKGAGDGEARLAGIDIAASHIWLEGLTVRDQAYATFSVGAPDDVVVSRNTFVNCHYCVYLQRGGTNWYIADNDITGDVDPASGSLDGEGIELNGSYYPSSGHVVAHNRITRVADGISAPYANVDIYGNDIFDVSDDGIELDPGRANLRVWGNRIQMALHNGVSFQPQAGAPWYIIRNQLVSFSENPFKFRTVDRFVLLHNTIVNWGNIMPCCVDRDDILKAIGKNNLWISVTGGPVWPMDNGTLKDWRTDLNYNGFDWGSYPTPFTYAGLGYPDIPALAAVSGLEAQGIRVNKSTCFETLDVPGPPPATVPPQVMTLKTGCNAIDAGTILPNVNDGFGGSAPDLGAHEYGQALPQYGPRPVTAAPTPALKVYRAGTPITADGDMGEWGGADVAAFSGLSNTASASLLWDDTNLYVAFQVTDTQLSALATARDDGNLWQDDSVEVYVDTRGDRASAMQPDDYQFLVNLNNVQVDLRGTGSGKDPAWNGTWQSGVRLWGTVNNNGDADSGYTVELAIPWAQIGVTPVSGMVLGVELAVNDSDPGSTTAFDQLDWAGIAPAPYAQPSLWKQVELVGTLPPLADTTPPVIAITSPAAGATVSGTITVAGTAADNVAVSSVEVRVDGGAPQTASGTSAWTLSLNTLGLANGTHTIVARAVDAAGNAATASATVTVFNDTTAPAVALTSPAAGATVAGTVTVAASATDNVGVAGVRFQVDGVDLGAEDTTAPYGVAWDTRTILNGAHTLTAVARDATGNRATSAPVTVTVFNDTTAPAVALTSPAAGATVAGTVTVAASATDNVGVAGVRFFVDGVPLGAEDPTAPYAISWDTTAVANGAHTLTAVARDTSGNLATSAGAVVTVDNDTTPPVISWVAAVDVSSAAATITWTTDEPSDTQVEYGPTAAYGSVTALDATRVTAHAQTLGGLAPGALYHYRVRSRDAAGNLAVSGDLTFTTSSAPPDLVIYRASGPITVDGRLDDWQGARVVQFSGLSNSATAYLAWDATYLYVAFAVTDARLSATRTKRDSATLWKDDAVEVYVDTRNDRAGAMQPDDYQLLVNLNNVQADLRGTGSGKDPRWNAAWTSAVQLAGTLNSHGDADSGYVVEMAVPWAQLGVTPAAGMTVGLDLVVDDSDPSGAAGYETFDWAGIAPASYAQPALWKQVQLADAVPVARTPTPITVDGALADWSRASVAQFSGLSNGATAYLTWDATNLYVAFEVTDARLSATRTTRDSGDLWQDDAVEVYIDTRNDRAGAMQPDDYQLLVNLNNVQADLRGTGSGKDPSWNPAWTSAVRLAGTLNSHGDSDGGYVVEMAIPWAQLGVTPAAGMTLALDLVVDDSDPSGATGYETFDWAGIAPASYAQPRLWKPIRLTD